MSDTKLKYQRVLLKLSGEVFGGEKGYGIDIDVLKKIANEIKEIHQLGAQVAIVVGGGNIFRGVEITVKDMDQASGDYMGMLATVMNALALQNALEKLGIYTRVLSAIEMKEVAEPYIRRRAIRHLEKRRIVIFAGGTGNPYFTTDTAASLRAMEIKAEVILKATKVDGVYSADPLKDKHAEKFQRLTYIQILEKGLKVMDATAIPLCMNNNLPIVVFDLNKKGNIKKVLTGKQIGTVVTGS